MSGVIKDESKKKISDCVKEMENTVKTFEENIKELEHTDIETIMTMQNDKIKYQGISNQLEEALKENHHLLNILQQKCNEPSVSRTNSLGDINGSCSTMSMVHLQYKYEELLANHHGLLKLLAMKSEEIKKVHKENVDLKLQIEELNQNLSICNENCLKLSESFSRLKQRKNEKIGKLKIHKETLKMVHNQLVNVLHKQCIEKDNLISEEIKNCGDSDKALLLQEIRKNNMLAYENFQLHKKIQFLKCFTNFDKKKYEE